MKLTDTAVKKAKPTEKPYKKADGAGLYIEIMPNGSKYWRMKYRFAGKEKRLALGVYPEISLAVARKKHHEACDLLAKGIDPSEARKAQKSAKQDSAANSFEVVAREWLASHMKNKAASHRDKATSPRI